MQYFPLITKNSKFEKIMDNHRQAAAQKCTKMKKEVNKPVFCTVPLLHLTKSRRIPNLKYNTFQTCLQFCRGAVFFSGKSIITKNVSAVMKAHKDF